METFKGEKTIYDRSKQKNTLQMLQRVFVLLGFNFLEINLAATFAFRFF